MIGLANQANAGSAAPLARFSCYESQGPRWACISSYLFIAPRKSGKTWEQFVKERILDPLGMNSTSYSISDMLKRPEFGVGFTERRDSLELYRIPYYEDI
jgi:hypothetical protein